jgi:hypothetical protein
MISDYQQLAAPVGPATAGTETVAIANVLDSGSGGNFPQGRVIRGYLNVVLGASGTSFTIKCRQGVTAAGTQVGLTQTITLAAATTDSVPFSFQDNTAAGAGSYCVTVTSTGGTITVNDGALEITMPDPYGSEV